MNSSTAQVSTIYNSTSVNRNSHVADWTSICGQSILAFASHKSISICRLNPINNQFEDVKLIQTTSTKVITSLKFIDNPLDSILPSLIVGSEDGNVFIYQPSISDNRNLEWNLLLTLDNQNAQISALGVMRPRTRTGTTSTSTSFILTGSSDGFIKLWSLNLDSSKSGFELIQTINLKGPLPLDIAVTALPKSGREVEGGEEYLMALGLTDRRIRIFAGELENGKLNFSQKLILEGHEDWIRSLDFCNTLPSSSSSSQNALMLASGSQDNSIRLWKIREISSSSSSSDSNSTSTSIPTSPNPETKDEFDLLASRLEGDIASNQGGISNKAHLFNTSKNKKTWAITFDALLIGHEDKITGVRWHPVVGSESDLDSDSSNGNHSSWQPAALLTSSGDNSLILWSPSSQDGNANASGKGEGRSYLPNFSEKSAESNGVWLPEIRFGEVGGTGTSSLGYYGGLFSPSSTSEEKRQDPTASLVFAHGWGGATHLWSRISNKSKGKGKPSFNQINSLTGHFMGVKSLSWEKNGRWFLSASRDRTVRLHGIHRSGKDQNRNSKWLELARPQTHGYDFSSICYLSQNGLSFISAADEKVVRIFEAPRSFLKSMSKISGRKVSAEISSSNVTGILKEIEKPKNLVLILNVPDLATFSNPETFENQVKAAVNRVGEKLTLLILSPLFNGLGKDVKDGECKLSFRQIEDFLKYFYSESFGIAVKLGRLMLDISVLLLPSSTATSDTSSSILSSLSLTSTSPSEIEIELISSPADKDLLLSLIPDKLRDQMKLIFSSPSSATIQPESKDSVDGKSNETKVPFPRHGGIALGGTFDHLHVGHKILLSMSALVAKDRIVVGVTGESMLSKKSNAHLLEPLSTRLASVENFLTLFLLPFSPLEQSIVELQDVCGPAGSEANLGAVLLTEETISGGEMIAEERSKKGLNQLERYMIGVIGKDGERKVKGKDAKELAAGKVGSTAIREWLRKKIEDEERNVGEKLRVNEDDEEDEDDERAAAASVPALGLSNRAVHDDKATATPTSSSVEAASKPSSTPSLPHEDILHLSTLWPEQDKLYGHGYELLSIASSPSSRFIATTCKAQSEKHAVIRIYDSRKRWDQIQVLEGHSLSITRCKFSPDGKFLISGSRDRSFRIWKIEESQENDQVRFELIAIEKIHSRIIWDLTWDDEGLVYENQDEEKNHFENHWSGLFATGSRDKTVKIWKLLKTSGEAEEGTKPFVLKASLKLQDSVTSVAFGLNQTLAVGMENGDVAIYQPSNPELKRDDESIFKEWKLISLLKTHHTETVSQMSFRPRKLERSGNGKDEDGWEDLMLLSGGMDGAVRLIGIQA